VTFIVILGLVCDDDMRIMFPRSGLVTSIFRCQIAARGYQHLGEEQEEVERKAEEERDFARRQERTEMIVDNVDVMLLGMM